MAMALFRPKATRRTARRPRSPLPPRRRPLRQRDCAQLGEQLSRLGLPGGDWGTASLHPRHSKSPAPGGYPLALSSTIKDSPLSGWLRAHLGALASAHQISVALPPTAGRGPGRPFWLPARLHRGLCVESGSPCPGSRNARRGPGPETCDAATRAALEHLDGQAAKVVADDRQPTPARATSGPGELDQVLRPERGAAARPPLRSCRAAGRVQTPPSTLTQQAIPGVGLTGRVPRGTSTPRATGADTAWAQPAGIRDDYAEEADPRRELARRIQAATGLPYIRCLKMYEHSEATGAASPANCGRRA